MKEYIRTMREMIGHAPMILCGASVIVYRDGEILLQRRRDNGCWGYFGGAVDLGESVEDAARRELFEESGLRAGQMTLFGVYSGEGMHYIYPNGDEVHNIDTVFVCRDVAGELRAATDEITDARWFSVHALPDNLSPPIKRPLHDFAKQFGRFAKHGDIVPVTGENAKEFASMCAALWPEHTQDVFLGQLHAGDFRHAYLCREDRGGYAGMILLSLRHDYVEGTDESPVGYIEGIYVSPASRGRGIARRLVAHAAAWTRAQGSGTLASDCALSNAQSRAFHQRVGFKEANTIVCFTMNVEDGGDA